MSRFIVALWLVLAWVPASASAESVAGPRVRVEEIHYRWGASPQSASGAPSFARGPGDAGWKTLSSLAELRQQRGDELWIAVRLPRVSDPAPALFLPQVRETFEVYLNGNMLGSSGDRDAVASAFHLLLLPEDYAAHWCVVRVRSRYSKIGLRGEMYVGSRGAHVAAVLRKDAGRMVAVIVLVLSGVIALLLSVYREQRPALLGFGLFCLSAGGWDAFYTAVRELFLPSPQFWLGLWALSLAWATSAFLLFFNALFQRGERALTWLLRVNIASALVGSVGLFIRPPMAVSNAYLALHRVLIGVTALFVIYYLARRVRERDRSAYIFLGGILVFMSFAVHDVLLSLNLIGGVETVAHWGHLVFVGSAAWIVRRRYSQARNDVKLYAAQLARSAGEREMMLRDLHDGMGRITTGIALLAESGKQASADPPLDSIAALAREGSQEIRVFMQGLDDESCDWENLEANMRLFANQTLEALGGQFELTVDRREPVAEPSPYLYVQLLRVFQEGLTNAVKHSEGKRVEARLGLSALQIDLELTNDAVRRGSKPRAGINASAGLNSMRARTEELGGELSFSADPESGVAELKLRIPLPLRYAGLEDDGAEFRA